MSLLLAQQPQAGPTIFVIDDYEDSLLLVSYALEALTYKVVQGRSGSEAIELATRYEPDLILLDILLPDMDGTAVINHLHKHLGLQHIPVIAVTGLDEATDGPRLLEAGFAACLYKPYSLRDLHTLVSEYLVINSGIEVA